MVNEIIGIFLLTLGVVGIGMFAGEHHFGWLVLTLPWISGEDLFL